MEFKFGAMNIYELGKFISDKLKEDGITEQSELSIYVPKDKLMKIDEDLFYRNKTNESDSFIPSEGEIIINFDLVKIFVKEKL